MEAITNMKKFAVIVAGGQGQRMGTTLPKQFLLLKGKPLLWYTIQTFLKTYEDLNIVLVLPREHLQAGVELINEWEPLNRIQVTEGGPTRFDSVRCGLALVPRESVIFVHDGVRCLVTPELIRNCYTEALAHGTAIPAVAATDSIRISGNAGSVVADRNAIRIIQTPQTFLSNILLPAFELPYQESFTDEANVVEAAGYAIHLIEGDYRNIKVTRPIDLIIAESMLDNWN